MNIALFGGTFDPIHAGHVKAAKAAAHSFDLDRVLLVPSGNPPHKRRDRLTPFPHRFAMVALAATADARFVPSLLEAPRAGGRVNYSVETLRKVRECLKSADRLYFLLGLDSFLDLPNWKNYRLLVSLTNLIVVSRPGFGHKEVLEAAPAGLALRGLTGEIGRSAWRSKTLHVLRGVNVPVASRDIRVAVRDGRRITGLVPRLVEQYILKEGLYRERR